jgi:small GTP-binding protein
VGRPNVGKSSLLNQLLGEERTVVSNVPGTTRDAIDDHIDHAGRYITLVDTAGIKKRGRIASGPVAEKYATVRSVAALDRADVALLLIDASTGLQAQDLHVAGSVIEAGKGLVIVMNKWDLVEKDGFTFDTAMGLLRRQAPFLDFAPILSISALTRRLLRRMRGSCAFLLAHSIASWQRRLRAKSLRIAAVSVRRSCMRHRRRHRHLPSSSSHEMRRRSISVGSASLKIRSETSTR